MDRSSLLVLTYALEAKDAVRQSIQGVIAADPYIEAGVDAGAALSVKDVAGLDKLAVSLLGAESWWIPFPFYGQRTEGSNLT